MKKVRILFFIYQMGAGGAARTLLNILNNLDRSKFEPVLVTLNYNGSYEAEINEDVIFKKLSTQRLSRSIFKLAKIIRNENIDVVFSTIPRVNTIAVLATIFSFSKAKAVVREADNLDGNWFERLKLIGFGLIYRLSNQVISLSEGVKENLVKRYKLTPDLIKVIYNPVDIENIQQRMHEPLDAQLNIDQHRKTILTVGRLVPQKDQKTLLQAFSKVNAQIPSQLIILGEGELESQLRRLTKELNIELYVHFVGFVRNPYQYFSQSDLFVLSSIHEGFSHVVAESLATGTPVVSTDCKSGPREVLDNGKYGYLVPVGDEITMAEKIIEALQLEETERRVIINNGLTRASVFNVNKIVKDYEAVFLAAATKK